MSYTEGKVPTDDVLVRERKIRCPPKSRHNPEPKKEGAKGSRD